MARLRVRRADLDGRVADTQTVDDVTYAGRELGTACVPGARLNEDAFLVVALVRLVQRAVGAAGLADAHLALTERLRADRAADGKRRDDECDPSEDGDLAVPGAPATSSRRDVPVALHCPSSGSGLHRQRIDRRRGRFGAAGWRPVVWLSAPSCARVRPWSPPLARRYQGSFLVSSRNRSRGGGSGRAGGSAVAWRSARSMRASSSSGSNGLPM